jgi:hypothetical protein
MFAYRLSKYNKANALRSGGAVSEDWTSISDIGKVFSGELLTEKVYKRIEDDYVVATIGLLNSAGIKSVRITDLEFHPPAGISRLNDKELLQQCSGLSVGAVVEAVDLEPLVRCCLREHIWCRLIGPNNSYIHFGYDFYLYLGLPVPADLSVVPTDLCLETHESPWAGEND